MRNVSLLGWSGLPECFAPCPPRFALLLYLRKALTQTALRRLVFARPSLINTSQQQAGWVCLCEVKGEPAGRRT